MEQGGQEGQQEPGGIFGPTSFAGAQWAGLGNRTQNNQANNENQLNQGVSGIPPVDANAQDQGVAGKPGPSGLGNTNLTRPSYRYDSNKDGKIDDKDDIDPKYKMGRGGNILGGMRLGGMMGQQYSNPYARLGSVIGGALRGLFGGNPGGELKYQEDLANYNKELAITEAELRNRTIQQTIAEQERKAREAEQMSRDLEALRASSGNPNAAQSTRSLAMKVLQNPNATPENRASALATIRDTLTSRLSADDKVLADELLMSMPQEQVIGIRAIRRTESGNFILETLQGNILTSADGADKTNERTRTYAVDRVKSNSKLMTLLKQKDIEPLDFVSRLSAIDQESLIQFLSTAQEITENTSFTLANGTTQSFSAVITGITGEREKVRQAQREVPVQKEFDGQKLEGRAAGVDLYDLGVSATDTLYRFMPESDNGKIFSDFIAQLRGRLERNNSSLSGLPLPEGWSVGSTIVTQPEARGTVKSVILTNKQTGRRVIMSFFVAEEGNGKNKTRRANISALGYIESNK